MKEYVLDTTELPDGQYTLKLVAADAAGNENEAATTLSVLNMMPLLLSMTLIGLAAGGGIASAIWLAVMRRRRAAADESASQ
jgi:hypothetical protein